MTMHEPDEHQNSPDAGLSAEYRAIATEKAPARLDRAVLQMAAAELRAGARSSAWRGWHRPAAYIATVGLTVALVQQLTGPPPIPPPPDAVAPTHSSSSFEDAAAIAREQVRQVEAEAAAMSASAPGDAAVNSMQASPSEQDSLQSGEPRCSEQQRSTASGWWRCILALEKRGQAHAAESEMQELLQAFPQFVVPD